MNAGLKSVKCQPLNLIFENKSIRAPAVLWDQHFMIVVFTRNVNSTLKIYNFEERKYENWLDICKNINL